MRSKYLDRLLRDGLISTGQHELLLNWIRDRPFSVHWELRALLYAGVLLFISGLGIFLYEHIDEIGHNALIAAIGALCFGSFAWCLRRASPYTNLRSKHIAPLFDYVLLLACLLFLTLEGYLQFQYKIFGTRYGLASLVPALVFTYAAFRFDHLGILSMAITAFAAFAGFTVQPVSILQNDFSEAKLVYTGIVFACLLFAAGTYLYRQGIKTHFKFAFYNYATHVMGITLLGALNSMRYPYLYFVVLLAGAVLLSRYAFRTQSRYFLLVAVLYAYLGCAWAVDDLRLIESDNARLLYFIFSGLGVVWFLLNLKRFMKGGAGGIQ